ncbi:MAG: glycosyltransferase [Chloroflexota bacterium]
MISKACLVGTYQKKLELIAAQPDVDLQVIIPPSWNDRSGTILAERRFTEGYQLIIDPINFNGSFHTHYYPKLKQRLSNFKPDIVHIDEEPYNLATWLAWRQSNKVKAKTLFFTWQNINRAYPPPFSWMEKQVLNGVDYALMGNEDAVTVWQEKGYRGPYRIIPQFGVDPMLFQPPTRRDSGRPLLIGSANRRLVPEKGVDTLLHALADLPGLWRAVIAGEGPEKQNLIQLTRQLGLEGRVSFEGAVSSADMPRFLQSLDVLVLSSRTLPNWKEQFGRILIEAMACEVAVVGSSSGEIPHVIQEAGLTFSEDDVPSLSQQLNSLISSETLRDSLGRQGRQHVLANYTQAKIATNTVEVYREIMAK